MDSLPTPAEAYSSVLWALHLLGLRLSALEGDVFALLGYNPDTTSRMFPSPYRPQAEDATESAHVAGVVVLLLLLPVMTVLARRYQQPTTVTPTSKISSEKNHTGKCHEGEGQVTTRFDLWEGGVLRYMLKRALRRQKRNFAGLLGAGLLSFVVVWLWCACMFTSFEGWYRTGSYGDFVFKFVAMIVLV